MRLKEWLDVSTEGFARRQADRPPEHLAKELVQNALDATENTLAGWVNINLEMRPIGRKHACWIEVADNGCGISDLGDLRMLFCSGKEDSHLLRGRLGQGFKEILCLALEAEVLSRGRRIRFHIVDGKRMTDIEESAPVSPGHGAAADNGSLVRMAMPWADTDIPRLVVYFQTFIIPAKRKFTVNGQEIAPRLSKRSFNVNIQTELFYDGRWVRRHRDGIVQLIPIQGIHHGSVERPVIYEMGIPVCPIFWTQPYHINVLMRIPMNPRRDAVATGYLKEVYAQILPMLLDKMTSEQLRDEWVSEALEHVPAPIRKKVVLRAFGTNAVRSVPTMGKRDWDSDAREMGLTPVNTRLLPHGLRDAAEEVMKSSKRAEVERRQVIGKAEETKATTNQEEAVKACYVWLASELVGFPVAVEVVNDLVIHGKTVTACWSPGGPLKLNARESKEWMRPFAPKALGLLAHEVSHEIALHHGDDFRRAVELVAGRLARLCLDKAEEIRERFKDLCHG